jgi:hypothetical protein
MTPMQNTDSSGPRWGRWLVWFAVLVVFGIVLYVARPEETTVPWTEDLRQAQSTALQTGQSILIEFYKPHEPAFLQMDREVFARPEVQNVLTDWITVRVDATRTSRTADDYEIDAWPTYVVLAPDGTILGRHVGTLPVDAFVAFVRSLKEPSVATQPQ